MKLKAALLIAGLLPVCAGVSHAGSDKPIASRPPIDIVFAIDCSGSMGPVIETAKQKVWDIVNEVARAKPAPRLRIGLLAYGDATRTFFRYDLSDDLDTVYANLMKFKDEGWSEEYVGLAVGKSLKEMSWAPVRGNAPHLRVIYVVGNETAHQGDLDYTITAKRAAEEGAIVNAIFCGQESGQDSWQQMAALGNGKYLAIAADGGSVLIATPYDGKIDELNTRLNKTYLSYGSLGHSSALNQAMQDRNAAAVGGAASNSSRAAAKASNQYNNPGWDLVDALKEKKVDLAKIKPEDLPENMRNMTPQQRSAHVQKTSAEREAIKHEILATDKKRQEYIQAQMKKRGKTNSLDNAVGGMVRSQGARGGFSF